MTATVVVNRSVEPENGEVVVTCIDGAVSLKLFRGGRLAFANPALPDESAGVEIWGMDMWTLHKPRG